jgi:hypothetical protein
VACHFSQPWHLRRSGLKSMSKSKSKAKTERKNKGGHL